MFMWLLRELDRLLPRNLKKIGDFAPIFRAENGTLFYMDMESWIFASDMRCSNKTIDQNV